MTIDEAIKARVERFNRLWLAETGHSFEEDPQWCVEKQATERKEWQPKWNAVLEKHGFKNENEYFSWIQTKDPWENKMSDEDKKKDDEINKIYSMLPRYTSLYPYDDMIHQQVKSIVKFLESKFDSLETAWATITKDTILAFEVVEKIKKLGYKDWNDDHSGNSGSYCIVLLNCFINKPELFPYMHGALANLVGDKGYHDNRTDLPKKE